MNVNNRGIDELTTYQFMNVGEKGYMWTCHISVQRYRHSVNWIY
jgi:hypothetical protein